MPSRGQSRLKTCPNHQKTDTKIQKYLHVIGKIIKRDWHILKWVITLSGSLNFNKIGVSAVGGLKFSMAQKKVQKSAT